MRPIGVGHGRRTAWLRMPAFAAALAWVAPGHAQGLIELSAGVHRIEAELAADFETRMQGLMYRKSMPANRGMLFVFTAADKHCMWMRNTYLPLSVAFIHDDGSIANIADMEPLNETTHCAVKPVRYALEMNRGWFAQRGLKPGSRLIGLDKAPAPR